MFSEVLLRLARRHRVMSANIRCGARHSANTPPRTKTRKMYRKERSAVVTSNQALSGGGGLALPFSLTRVFRLGLLHLSYMGKKPEFPRSTNPHSLANDCLVTLGLPTLHLVHLSSDTSLKNEK
jgi:hypothetical protein